jgi:hypothetical protein
MFTAVFGLLGPARGCVTVGVEEFNARRSIRLDFQDQSRLSVRVGKRHD